MSLLQVISRHIEAHTGKTFTITRQQQASGGCINQAMSLSNGSESYFIKFNHIDNLDMFQAEAEGLRDIAAHSCMRVPRVITMGTSEQTAFLVLEHLTMGGKSQPHILARHLANMHEHNAPQYGWSRANTIGTTPQPNNWTDKWATFWREQRLGHQLRIAAERGVTPRLLQMGDKILANIDAWLADYQPKASLLHGDLWSGNYAYLQDGTPVVFDPALYYGDRETDMAMTELFGGFEQEFYVSYQAHWPLPDDYQWRKYLYNLYHVLNHANLFNGGYVQQAMQIMQRLFSEMGTK